MSEPPVDDLLPAPAELLDLAGRVILVTGAAGGIGRGVAERLSRAGAAIVAHSRTSSLDPLVEAASGPVETVYTDLNEAAAPERLVATALERFGRLDGLVNNAALQTLAPLSEVDGAAWREMFETNVEAVHRTTRRAVAAIVSSERSIGGGSIVHIASIEGRQPAPAHGHYAASKAALAMHARAAALEFGPLGVRVNSISPGLIDREGLAEAWPDGVERWRKAAPLGRLGSPADIADACVFLLSPLSRWITGIDLVVDGGVLARPTW